MAKLSKTSGNDFPDDLFPGIAPSFAPASGQMTALPGPLSEVAPGVFVSGRPAFETPSHCLCRLVPLERPGTYALEPEPHPGWVRMSDDIGKRLGIIGLSVTTLRRLLRCGFIEHVRLHPSGIFISIESLLEHFRVTRNDCEKSKTFWTESKRAAWKESYDSPLDNIEDL